jgi:hypothetical protein
MGLVHILDASRFARIVRLVYVITFIHDSAMVPQVQINGMVSYS